MPANVLSDHSLVKVLPDSRRYILSDVIEEHLRECLCNKNESGTSKHESTPWKDSTHDVTIWFRKLCVHGVHCLHDPPTIQWGDDTYTDCENNSSSASAVWLRISIKSLAVIAGLLLGIHNVIHRGINRVFISYSILLGFLQLFLSDWVFLLDFFLIKLDSDGDRLFTAVLCLLLRRLSCSNEGWVELGKLSKLLCLFISLGVLLGSLIGSLSLSLSLTGLCIGSCQLGVDTVWVVSQKRVVITDLDELTFLHDNDLVGFSHSGESMSNHNGRDRAQLLLHLIDGLLDLGLIDLVEGAGGLIEDQDAWLLEEGTSEGNSLLLTTGELATAGSNVGVDALWVLADEAPCVCLLKGLFNFFIGSVWLAHEQVLLDRRVEKYWLLADVTNLLSVEAQVDRL